MLKIKHNMGTADRAARTIVGIALLTLGPLTDLVVTDTLSTVLLSVLGVIALGSALLSYCFLYEVTGFNTLRDEHLPTQ